MKRLWPLRVLLLLLAVNEAAETQLIRHPMNPPTVKKDLYPDGINARKEIGEALVKAAKSQKRVLLVFGANWCYDCHVLDKAFHEPTISPIVESGYEIVHVNIGEGDKNLDLAQKYKVNLGRGVPALAILSSKGDVLYSDQNGEFEKARSMAQEDLLLLLQKWAPKS